MANTYHQIYIHAIFGVKYTGAVLNKKWQRGYGAFSYSQSHLDSVYNYILNQEKHHKKQTLLS
jgi:hypothetical protein